MTDPPSFERRARHGPKEAAAWLTSTCAVAALGAAIGFGGCAGSPAVGPRSQDHRPADATTGLFAFDFLGQAVLSTEESFEGTVVGGLSGLSYDAQKDLYYAISDDPAVSGPARFYSLDIDLGGRAVAGGVEVTVVGVTEILDRDGAPFAEMSLDLESLTLTPERTLLISSEGQVERGIAPFLREIRLDGSFVRDFPIPKKFLPRAARTVGIRHNLGFESLAFDAAGHSIYTATENALSQDGPATDVGVASPARILRFDEDSGRPVAEYVYWVDPVTLAPIGVDGFRTRGLVELEALGGPRLLALERAYTQGVGNQIEIFLVSTENATDVRRWQALEGKTFRPVSKTRLIALEVLGVALDNIEGFTFGPRLADGRRSLVLVSDNNFSPSQQTQILAFAIAEGPGQTSLAASAE